MVFRHVLAVEQKRAQYIWLYEGVRAVEEEDERLMA